MGVDFWLSALLGAAVAGASALAGHALNRRAMRLAHPAFVRMVLGGLGLRLMIVVLVVLLVLLWAPVDESAFIGGLLAAFVAGLVFEVVWMHRSASAE